MMPIHETYITITLIIGFVAILIACILNGWSGADIGTIFVIGLIVLSSIQTVPMCLPKQNSDLNLKTR